MAPPRASIRKLADKLVGSVMGDSDYEVDELSHEECLELDSIAFECTCCNLWFSQRDNANPDGDWVCKECKD